jgi:UDP-GlcNAc:undecaprenyl-phosphate/decaprenyl-phosphate GlcNAc-1-phosphate transferase
VVLNLMSITYLFIAIVLVLVMILVVSRAFIQLTLRLGLVDTPGSASHKLHNNPTPVAGGLALVAVMLISAWMFGTYLNREIMATFISVLLVFAFGLWDDFKNLSPLIKLIGQVLAAVLLIILGVYIQIFESPEFFLQVASPYDLYLDWLLTIAWVVGITNAFNFVDSMDGLAVGIGAIASGFFMLMTYTAQQPLIALQCALLLGICAGLYFFNSPPALFFLGDSGAQTLGFMLAVIAIIYHPIGAEQSSSYLVPILVLGLPIFDTVLIIKSRVQRRQPIYRANSDHTYHRLVSLGLDSNHAVLTMQMVALLLGSLAFIALSQPPIVANAIFLICLMGGVVFLGILDRNK